MASGLVHHGHNDAGERVGCVADRRVAARQGKTVVHGDAGYLGAEQYVTRAERIARKIARRRSEVAKIRRARERVRAMRAEKRKAQVRARVEHPFRIVKCVFGYVKVRFKGLARTRHRSSRYLRWRICTRRESG